MADSKLNVRVFADAESGLDSVDQIIFAPGVGLLAGNEGSSSVLLFDNGEVRALIGPDSGLRTPDGLAIQNGSLIVADYGIGQFRRFSLGGRLLEDLGTTWSSPEGVVAGRDGSVYISDANHGLVVRQRPDGTTDVIATRLDGLRDPEQL